MYLILSTLYDILSYVTEDARANKILPVNFPPKLYSLLNEARIELGNYLGKNS